MSISSLLAAAAIVLVPGVAATLAAFRPGRLGVEAAVALVFGLGYAVAALTATALAVTGTFGRTSYAVALALVTAALAAAAMRWRSPAAHIAALAADARRSRWAMLPGAAGLAAFAVEKLRIDPVTFLSSGGTWRYWGDGLDIVRAGGVPGTTLQWGDAIPTTVSKVVLNSFEAGVAALAPRGPLPTMGAVGWVAAVGLFAALLALGRELGLRGLAVFLPVLVLAVPGAFPINPELADDTNTYRVETLGRMAAVCAAVIAVAIVRRRMARPEAAVAGVVLGVAAGTHLIPVAVLGLFTALYALVTVATGGGRRRRLRRIGASAAIMAAVAAAIWVGALAASGGDLGFQGARGSGNYHGFPASIDPTKSFETVKRVAPRGRRSGWFIPPARLRHAAVDGVFDSSAGLCVGVVVLVSALAVALRRRRAAALVVASWGTLLGLFAVGLYFSHRYRTFVPGTFGPRRLFQYGVVLSVVLGVAGASIVLRAAAARAGRERWRTLQGGAALAATALAVAIVAASPPPAATAEERAGLEVMATVARSVPCGARILVNARTEGSFGVLAGRPTVDEGMAPYLRPPILRRVVPIVLGAHRFFRDPAANRAYIQNQRVDVVVAVAGAKVGGRPVVKQSHRALLDGISWLRPLAETAHVSVYATPSFDGLARSAKNCYNST